MRSGTVRTICSSTVPSPGRLSTGAGQLATGDLVPPHREVAGDVADHCAGHRDGRVVPADVATRRMRGGVEAVAGLVRQVDAADEGDRVVDDDRLLVVAVHRPLARVERALDPRPDREAVAHLPHLCPGGPEHRQRGARPGEHADLDPLGGLGEQIAQENCLPAVLERELGREVPAGHVHVRARLADRVRHPRQRLGAVDENLERATRPGPGAPRGPSARGRVERPQPADSPETPPVMRLHAPADDVADPAIRPVE